MVPGSIRTTSIVFWTAEGQLTGRNRSLPDAIIASIALTQNCVLVTDNERDFPGVPTLNPMRPSVGMA